jgi:hypothetical protein
VGHQGQVVGILDRDRGQQREAGPAAEHHVRVIAEDAERVGGDRAGGDMDAERGELARDLEHVGDLEQQALRRSEVQ